MVYGYGYMMGGCLYIWECESTAAGRDHGMGWEAKGEHEFVRGLMMAASHAFCDVWGGCRGRQRGGATAVRCVGWAGV